MGLNPLPGKNIIIFQEYESAGMKKQLSDHTFVPLRLWGKLEGTYL